MWAHLDSHYKLGCLLLGEKFWILEVSIVDFSACVHRVSIVNWLVSWNQPIRLRLVFLSYKRYIGSSESEQGQENINISDIDILLILRHNNTFVVNLSSGFLENLGVAFCPMSSSTHGVIMWSIVARGSWIWSDLVEINSIPLVVVHNHFASMRHLLLPVLCGWAHTYGDSCATACLLGVYMERGFVRAEI